MPKLLVEKTSPHKNPITYDSHKYTRYRFYKVSMDIVTAPDNWKRTFVYTHDTRFAYEIFNGGAIQASNVSGNSRSIPRKFYQPVYRAESMDYRSGPEFYKQRNASYST